VALNKDGHCPLRFPGQYFDAETGLNYNYFRYYDPLSARYGSSDPLGLGPAPDPHAYVSNTTTWSDPLGLSACSTFFSVQNAKDVKRLLEHGGEPWPTGVTNGSLRDIFGPGLYTWETRAQAERYLQKWESKGATGLNIMEHRISSSDLAGLKSVDLSKIGDDAANKILDLGAGHGYEHIRRITGNYGPESYFSREVFHLFKNGIA
jgi:RHS repeat-associated protein